MHNNDDNNNDNDNNNTHDNHTNTNTNTNIDLSKTWLRQVQEQHKQYVYKHEVRNTYTPEQLEKCDKESQNGFKVSEAVALSPARTRRLRASKWGLRH